MIEATGTAGETAISYADQFLDAAIKKIDKAFGKGFAKDNVSLVQAYMHACALNLSSFMQSAIALQASGEFDDLIDKIADSDDS